MSVGRESRDLQRATIAFNGAEPVFSVVIAVRDGEKYLPDLLRSLAAQTLGQDKFEVIVVDDGSQDATHAVLQAWARERAESRLVLQTEGTGPAAARNVGFRSARGEWIAFTDGDTLPEPQWLERALQGLRQRGSDVLEGAVVPWPPEEAGPGTHTVSNHAGGAYMTANMIYRRSVLERLGGFHEGFAQPFLEDSDLAFRALDAGYEIPFQADAVVRHRILRPSRRGQLRATRKIRWFALLAARHPERFRTDLRAIVRPVSPVDLNVVVGLAALAGAAATRGRARVLLATVAVNGVRQGLARPDLLEPPVRDLPERVALTIALPVLRVAWWAEGCIRFRHFAW